MPPMNRHMLQLSFFKRIKKERRIENGVERSKRIACPSCSKGFSIFAQRYLSNDSDLLSFEGERVDGI